MEVIINLPMLKLELSEAWEYGDRAVWAHASDKHIVYYFVLGQGEEYDPDNEWSSYWVRITPTLRIEEKGRRKK